MVDTEESSAFPQIEWQLIDYQSDIDRINQLLKVDDHEICSKFGQGNCSFIGMKFLLFFRLMFLIPMLWLAKIILYTKPLDFWLLASYWGYHLAWMSLTSQIIASFGSSKFWMKLGCYTTELSFGMSIAISLLYWPFEWYNFMHDKRDFTLLTSFVVHTMPFIVSIFNLLFSKIVFLKKDAKYGLLL